MSVATVNIVLSDEGWILHTLARHLQQNIPRVTYDLDVNPSADIQYYMTYGTWRYRVSPREIGYFAHIEQDKATQQRFYDVADNMDWAVCHSRPYETILREHGMANVVTIPPGVDLERFQPRLKIGVVGRTYHTGRKGERLVAAVMDAPSIEWHFTGVGWPGPALLLSDDQMPDFYRSMDYILVPSLYEGGPMSVIEALACGCQVIAPPVGWVPEYPHIEYRTGDADDLRRVLAEVVAERHKLRQSVLDRGWNTWIDGHARLFEQLGASIDRPRALQVRLPDGAPALGIRSPGLIVHGTESGTDKGGPSVRAPRTALQLTQFGYAAKLLDGTRFDQREHDLYHVYNVWHPRTCRQAIEHVRLSGAPVVLSAIYLDLSEKRVFDSLIPKLFNRGFGKAMINNEYARLRELKARQLARGGKPHEPYEGFHDDVCNLTALADHLICLSEDERDKLAAIGADVSRATIVPNPVEPGLYSGATPELFEQTYGLRDYILCVGRLEARKNQITLLHALRDSGMPLVLVGHATNPDYDKLLRSIAGPNVTFLGRIPANSQMLASAYAGARVFCLPSWSEGAPLVALEAAAAGCNMVLSDRSSEREYFAERARYCDPCHPEQMLQTLTEAYEHPFSAEQRAELAGWTATNFSWGEHIRKTSAVYEGVFAARRQTSRPAAPPKIYVDLTSSAHRSGPPSGIARVEERYALELHELLPGRIVFVLWNSDRRTFIEVSHDQFVRGKHKQLPSSQAPSYLFDELDFSPAGRIAFERNSILLVLGGAWIRNENYVHSLAATKRLKGLLLVAFIHDVIQAKFKQWFPDKVGEEFTSNCRGLIEVADHLIANSRCTLADLREFCDAERLVTPPIDLVRFGDEIDKRGHEAEEEEPQFDRLLPILRGNPFILCVSAIDIRKNHLMLHNLWERMLAEHGAKTPNLIMVGSKGWNIDHFLALVEKNPRIRNSFHILNGINDATLDWLYRNCLFTLYPSLYEGWGLPVAEALNYGKVCVAARAGSVPEIAPEMTDLIDPLDFVSWYRVVTGYVLNPALLAKREAQIRAYQPVSWRASAGQLRDLLLNVSGQRRALPSMQLNRPVLLDEAGAKAQPVQAFKISGWYGPEKTGSWTAGQTATFQCELLGAGGEVLLLELSGNAFASEAAPSQEVGVAINGEAIGTLCWTGTLLHDVLIIPAAQVAALRAARELNLVFTLPQPMSPAAINPESTDKRLLGIKLASLCVRSLPCLTPDHWTELREPGGKEGEAAPLPCHGSHRGRSLKLPLLVRPADLPSGFDESVVVGLRLVVKSPADVELLISADGDPARRSTLKPGKIETRFVVLTREALRHGALLELTCPRANIADLSVVEYGVFSDLEELELLALRPGTVLDCTQAALTPELAAAAVDGSAASWALPPAQMLSRAAVQMALMTGWSRFEREGIWSIGQRAWLGVQVQAPSETPLVLAFKLRPYRLKHVDVRVNGRPALRWTFRNLDQRTQLLPLTLPELANGRAIIELGLDGAASPAAMEGKEDDRLLGVILASAALLDLAMAAQSLPGDKTPFAVDTAASFAAAADWPQDLEGWESAVQLLPRGAAEGLLAAGWSTIERAGVWSDGDGAFLLLRLRPGDVVPGQELVLVLAFRAFEAESLKIRAGGGEWTVWPATRHVQRRHLTLSSAQLAAGIILLELRPLDAATPAPGGPTPDDRRLGVFLTAIALLQPETFATLERRRLAGAQPGPLTLDLAQQALDTRFSLENWYPPEVHGRWTSQKPAYIVLSGHQYSEALRLAIIARTLDVDLPQPQDVTLLVNGTECGQCRLLPGVFQQTGWIIPQPVVAGAPVLRLELVCSFVAKPSELGGSADHRPLGILVRSLGLLPLSGDPAGFTLPGDRLCGPAKPAKLLMQTASA